MIVKVIIPKESSWTLKKSKSKKQADPDDPSLIKRHLKPCIAKTIPLTKVYAICFGRIIIYFLGRDKDGRKVRIYDIMSYHKKISPISNSLEILSEDYFDVFIMRHKSHYRYMVKNLFDYDLSIMNKLWEEQLEKSSNLFIDEAIKYLNRHVALIITGKLLVIMKTIQEVQENQIKRFQIKYTKYLEKDFVRLFARQLLGNKSQTIGQIWLNSIKQLRYSEIPLSKYYKNKTSLDQEDPLSGLSTTNLWWLEILNAVEGVLYEKTIDKTIIYTSYLKWHTEKNMIDTPATKVTFWMLVKKLLGKYYKEKHKTIKHVGRKSIRKRCLVIPSKEICRDTFSAAVGIDSRILFP